MKEGVREKIGQEKRCKKGKKEKGRKTVERKLDSCVNKVPLYIRGIPSVRILLNNHH